MDNAADLTMKIQIHKTQSQKAPTGADVVETPAAEPAAPLPHFAERHRWAATRNVEHAPRASFPQLYFTVGMGSLKLQ